MPLPDLLGPLPALEDDDAPAATAPESPEPRVRRARDMGPGAAEPVAAADAIVAPPPDAEPAAEEAAAPAAAAASPPGVDLSREDDEEDLDRGPCFRSSIAGFVCQKAHVNGTLRIHWTPYEPASARPGALRSHAARRRLAL